MIAINDGFTTNPKPSLTLPVYHQEEFARNMKKMYAGLTLAQLKVAAKLLKQAELDEEDDGTQQDSTDPWL